MTPLRATVDVFNTPGREGSAAGADGARRRPPHQRAVEAPPRARIHYIVRTIIVWESIATVINRPRAEYYVRIRVCVHVVFVGFFRFLLVFASEACLLHVRATRDAMKFEIVDARSSRVDTRRGESRTRPIVKRRRRRRFRSVRDGRQAYGVYNTAFLFFFFFRGFRRGTYVRIGHGPRDTIVQTADGRGERENVAAAARRQLATRNPIQMKIGSPEG